jgi:DNA-binding CsgD family transcriptional regulator
LLEGLTPTEREVAQMVLRGMTTKEIARALSRGASTVDFHRMNIRHKLGLAGSGQGLRALLLDHQR